MKPESHIIFSVIAFTWSHGDAVIAGVYGWLTLFPPHPITLVKPWRHYDLLSKIPLADYGIIIGRLIFEFNVKTWKDLDNF